MSVEKTNPTNKQTTTKKDLALSISQALGIKNELSYEIVAALFTAMRENLIQGNRIEVRGFGVLGVKGHWFSDIGVFNSTRNKVLCSADLENLGDRKPPLYHP